MPTRTAQSGSELFIVDNSDADWKALRYLHDWCQISKRIDIATGYFEIGALLGLKDEWKKVDEIRILMGGETSPRTREAFEAALAQVTGRLDASLENEKARNDFLAGVPDIVEAIRAGKISCRVYRKNKFHAKAYITQARLEVVGAAALVGSSNLTLPGLTENVELNVQITGRPVAVLQEWYEQHWNEAEDVTPDILRTVDRHSREYSPFEVYARAMHELFRGRDLTDREWFEKDSGIYPVLAKYQKDGFQELLEISARHRGAFLCDGVGLGKTFIGLMVLEYLVRRQRRKVLLLVPKGARGPVWGAALKKYLPKLLWSDSNLLMLNHTDLGRKKSADVDFPALWEHVREDYDAVVIDEAHHFRNPGVAGEESGRPSRYRQLFQVLEGKTLFLLTATPVNNSLLDLQHMMELFSRQQPDYFKAAPLGIHSLPGHFRKLQNALDQQTGAPAATQTPTNQAEAQQVLFGDDLFRALVVQRSRAYVKASQQQEGATEVLFPDREDPKVQPYSVKRTYGGLLEMVERAFSKKKPLFSLPLYCPLLYHWDPASVPDFQWQEGRQKQVVALIRTQFLKRFESSVRAFEMSCKTLLDRLRAFVRANSQSDAEKRHFEKWEARNAELIGAAEKHERTLWDQSEAEESDEDFVEPELAEDVETLPREQYKMDEILGDALDDLEQLADFLKELSKFESRHDDKLRALVKLLKSDPVLKKHKVLIFSEYMATARYVTQQLKAAGLEGVDEVDSAVKRDRGEIIEQFSPYYNGSSSAEVKAKGLSETRVLVSTDVLSEGLNLQDCTRLINYDLHWNPVRLMQRIGRVDRRLNRDTEQRIVAEHPEEATIRGKVAYWNFLPPDELDILLRLYSRVSGKVLAISKVFGIEGGKLLRPDDDYEALKDFTHQYEGTATPVEELHLEYQRLLQTDPGLLDRINALPGRVFSGKAHPTPQARAVFFCYGLPAAQVEDARTGDQLLWSEESGETRWYLYDLGGEAAKDSERILDDPAQVVAFIRCEPTTPRRHVIPNETLSEIRAKVERHIKNTYLKSVQAPVGAKPVLKAWMELS